MVTEPKVENPYVGPRPFEEQEQKCFFGRDWEADELVSLIVAHPAVLLYAQSGAGKTSLINAKLIPLLRDEEGLQVMPVARVRGEVPEEIQPEQIENLFVFNTLLDWIESGADPAQLVGLSLSAFFEAWLRPKDKEGQPTLRVIIFDQFEELFTLYPERWTEREGFFAQVADALAGDPFLRVLFALREDYLAQLDPYVALLPERLRARFRLERLRREAALAAVKGPLVDTGRSFAPGVAESLVEELLKIRVENRVGEAVEVPGEFVEPVQLQVVCRSLWEELPLGAKEITLVGATPREIQAFEEGALEAKEITLEHLRRFGDVDQALLTFYERALGSAVQKARVREGRLRAWFERVLITPMGTRGTAYRGTESTGGVPNAAIDVLEGQHLIRAERRAGARWYELTHDRFIGPIQRSNEARRAAQRERWLRTGGGIALVLVLLFVGTTVLQATISSSLKREVVQVQATVTVAAQEAGTEAARVAATATAAEATATAALDSEAQATAALRAWQTAQAQSTAASIQLTAAMLPPGLIETPSPDPTAIAAIETATAAAQSLQIAEQKVVAVVAEFKATATAAASATAAARELREQLQTAGFTGRGVKVAILSTGIDATHPDLEGRIAATADLIGEGLEDSSGSGTFVASIVAGNGAASGGLYKGLAPEVDLYIAKVMDPGEAGTMSDVIAGLEWAVEQKVDIVLVDVGGASGCDGSDELSQKADAAVKADLVVVVPAGNSGPEPGTVDAPGCAHLPITVGAAKLNTVADFSSRGPTLDGRTKPDLLFSGSGVGAQATGTKIGAVVAPGYVEATGSSVSAAYAAGAIALLLQAHPDLTPAEVKDNLMETATDLGFEANAQGAGLADIEKALAHVIDRDGDGISDAEDACPDEPGLPEHSGCTEPTPTRTNLQPLTGNELIQVTEDSADEYVPSFSPDQRTLLLMSNRTGDWQIFTLNPDGSNWKRLTEDGNDYHHARFSPDGKRIIFSSDISGDFEIYTMSTDGTDLRRLTYSDGPDTYPSYSLNGQRVVFMSQRSGTWGVYTMSADGSGQRAVIDTDAAEAYPYISPDGSSVAFQSDVSGNYEIYLISIDGGEPRQLTNNPARDAGPVFSPDGRRIVFETNRDGDYEVYVMNSDGSDQRNLTNFPSGNDQVPSTSPDGLWVVFQSDRNGSWDIFRTLLPK
jgi:subtilisin family serine protease